MNAAQLDLFQDPIPIGTLCKPGDWVKVCRKPRTCGAHLKRGDTVKVSAVNPTDGSIKFWNESCNSWDYLYPEDFKLTVESVVGLANGNNPNPTTSPTIEDKANPTTTAEPVIGLTDSNSNPTTSGWIESHYKVRVGGCQRSIANWEPKATGPYYQYRWKEGKRQRGKYLPRSKLDDVQEAIEYKAPPSEILKIISNQ